MSDKSQVNGWVDLDDDSEKVTAALPNHKGKVRV
jgi:hypothetical protein